MAKPRTRKTPEPHDRLTRICDAMTKEFDAHPEHREGDKCIVFLDDGEMGGIQVHGYESNIDAMVDLFMHLRAIFAAEGKELGLVGLPGNPHDN